MNVINAKVHTLFETKLALLVVQRVQIVLPMNWIA